MTNEQHGCVVAWITCFHAEHGKYPTHAQILHKMLTVADEVTYRDALDYGLGSTFRSRLSDLRKEHNIISYDKDVPTRYGAMATVKAHKLAEVSA